MLEQRKLKELLLAAGLAVLVVASNFDVVRHIPPLADDFWIIATTPWKMFHGFAVEHSWIARVLGNAYMALSSGVTHVTGAPVLAVVVFNRCVSLIALYAVLRYAFRFSSAVAMAVVVLFAFMPTANEGWTMLGTGHLAVSVPLVALSLALYCAVAAAANSTSEIRWSLFASAAGVQVLSLAFYEQAVLAIPAFVVVVVIWDVAVKRASFAAALKIAGIASVVSIAWLAALIFSGYVSSRNEGSGVSGVDPSDLLASGKHLWVAFVQHNLWRAVEFMHTRRLWVWDRNLAGLLGGIATLALAGLVAWCFMRSRESDGGSAEVLGVGARLSPIPAVLGSLAAAYAAILPVAFAYPGFTGVSRIDYTPAFFVALGAAALLAIMATRWRLGASLLLAVAVLWSGILSRRYLTDMRQGTDLVREFATAVLQVPTEDAEQGILVVATDNVGTFSTSAVQAWSFRAAVRYYAGRDVAGPMYYVGSCEAAQRSGEALNENTQEVAIPNVGAVLVRGPEGVKIYPSLESACQR